jgi:serine/threonine protein kinase
MKRCPTCKTTYPDDANFCPMDAGRLEALVAAPVPVPPPPSPSDDQTHNLLGGRFRIGSPIGGHRTGQIFTGTDLTTGREVAIKLVSPQVFPTPLVAQRSERELKQLQKVHSDRVTLVVDVGHHAGNLWVATELVHGTTLAEIVYANGPMPAEHAVRLALEIGEGLAEAAKLGVIHRDVSPKNVLVLPDGRVKLLNFGIPTPVTERVQGIPEFLSPEQAEGKPVDQRSNIYSLGALLTYMLTGQPLFGGDVDAVLNQQVAASPAPPSARGVAVRADLERIIMKTLEKSSSRRHLTLRQLLAELEALLVTAVASPPSAVLPTAATAHTVMGVSVNAAPADRTMMGVMAPRTGASQPLGLEVSAPGSIHVPVQPKTQVLPPVAPQQTQTQPPAPQMPPTPPQRTVLAPPQPSPYAQTQPSVPAVPAAAPAGAGKGKRGREGKAKFRETMWFKKGELDEAVAAAGVPEGELVPEKADSIPMEDRYKDDGTLSAADRERLSLRTGGTQSFSTIPSPSGGHAMGERELARELGAGRGRMILMIVLALLIVGALVVYFGVLKK